MKKSSRADGSAFDNRRSRSVLMAVLLVLVVLLSLGSGLYAGASFFPQQAPNVTITTTIYTTTTSWMTSTVWSTITQVVLGVLTTIEYTTSTSTVTVSGTPTPVVVTIGYAGYSVGYASGYAVASPVTLSSSGTVTSIGMNFYGAQSGNVRVALYSAGSGRPASLLTQSASFAVSGSTGWRDIAVTPYSASAGSYWVAFQLDRVLKVYYGPGSRSYYSKPFGAFDATWSATSGQDSYYVVNMRVTYTTVLGFAMGGSPIWQTIGASPSIYPRDLIASSCW